MTATEWSESVDPEPMLGQVLPTASDRKRRLFAVACCRRIEDWLVGDLNLVLEGRDDDYRNAVTAAEQFADGKVTAKEMRAAFWNADDSAFCNETFDEMTIQERRQAIFGDDAHWQARFLKEHDDEDEPAIAADPAAWLEEGDNVDCLTSGLDPFRDVADHDAVLIGETIGRQVLLLARHYGGRDREAQERAAQAALIRDVFGDPSPPPGFNPAWRMLEVTEVAEGIDEEKAFDRMPILADALESAGCNLPALLGHCRGPGPHVRGCWALDLVLGKA